MWMQKNRKKKKKKKKNKKKKKKKKKLKKKITHTHTHTKHSIMNDPMRQLIKCMGIHESNGTHRVDTTFQR